MKHHGKPEILINVGGMQDVLVNDGKAFRVPTLDEQQQILLEFQRTGQP